MKNLLSKFVKEENGDVVQWIIVMAVAATVFLLLGPKIKTWMDGQSNDVQNKVGTATA